MKPEEYEIMASVEAEHWWYRGLRGALSTVFARIETPADLNVLDAGCGTGENLSFLREQLNPAYLGGFDVAPFAVRHARQKHSDADVYQSDICEPEMHCDDYDLITSCDVICIPGVEAAFDGLTRMVDRLRSGGRLVLNLPAYLWLYSQHDVAYGTTERYTATSVRKLMKDLGLSVEFLTYRMCCLFPLVVLRRTPSLLRLNPNIEDARSNVRMPSLFVNVLLSRILAVENSAIRGRIVLPFGSSVFCVGRKP